MKNVLLLAVCAVLLLATQVNAAWFYDSGAPAQPNWISISDGLGVAQKFTLSSSYELRNVSIAAACVGGRGTGIFALYTGDSDTIGEQLISWEVSLRKFGKKSSYWSRGKAPGGITLLAGTTYWAALIAPEGATLKVLDNAPNGNEGVAWYSGSLWSQSSEGSSTIMGLKLSGKEVRNAPLMPEPTSLAAFGSTAIFTCWLFRRNRAAKRG